MGEIRCEKVSVTTTGTAGSATGDSTSAAINGWIESIYLDFNGSAPGSTTDTTVSFSTRGGNILAVSNSATDALFTPRAKPVDNANGAITNAHARFACNQAVKVALDGCDALTDAVVAYIYYEKA